MKNLIKLLISSLFLVCTIYALIDLSSKFYEVGSIAVALASVFFITSILTLYSILSKIKVDEYPQLSKWFDFGLLVVQVTALLWQSIRLYMHGEILFAVLLTMLALLGGYMGYLFVKQNKK